MGYSIDPISANCYPGTSVLINKFDIQANRRFLLRHHQLQFPKFSPDFGNFFMVREFPFQSTPTGKITRPMIY